MPSSRIRQIRVQLFALDRPMQIERPFDSATELLLDAALNYRLLQSRRNR
jgi:hypothetical protein